LPDPATGRRLSLRKPDRPEMKDYNLMKHILSSDHAHFFGVNERRLIFAPLSNTND